MGKIYNATTCIYNNSNQSPHLSQCHHLGLKMRLHFRPVGHYSVPSVWYMRVTHIERQLVPVISLTEGPALVFLCNALFLTEDHFLGHD